VRKKSVDRCWGIESDCLAGSQRRGQPARCQSALVRRFAGPGTGLRIDCGYGEQDDRGSGAHDESGKLNLTVNVDVADADVDVVVTVTPVPVAPDAADENGWPVGFFERVAGSMPDLRRGSQGEFEERLPLG